ncbi:hypothetical protein BN874_2670001 [Candidatus Contendobacter odensis Run_B_J11]|uniref:Uncharacterized protein n=1 Tax=Candidatus Contendobacter odensis Run_B_J11 TaxID=1400861 RepID=A0A7U7GC43_9GAMM|nr:hypothetical protein BN874_2670001 [Candidatus Contendobacter odensis Run_B_J11]
MAGALAGTLAVCVPAVGVPIRCRSVDGGTVAGVCRPAVPGFDSGRVLDAGRLFAAGAWTAATEVAELIAAPPAGLEGYQPLHQPWTNNP